MLPEVLALLPERTAPAALQVLDARMQEDREAWIRAWDQIARGDLFSHPAYLEGFAGPGESPFCAIFTGRDGDRVLYAFLRRPILADGCGRSIPEGHWDLYTALLYGGPLVESGTRAVALRTDFWSAFREWARQAGAVSEFIRTDPAADRLEGHPGAVREQAPHIVRDLSAASLDELYADMRSNARRGVARAREGGLRVVTDTTGELLNDFMRIYDETMDRTGAAQRFRHTPAVFRALHTAFPGRFAYVYAMDGDHPVSVELMLFSDEVGYFFLGGTETAALRRHASVLVHWEAIALAWERGLRAYVLTGGVTNSTDDSLLRFKRSFAPRGMRPYRTSAQVFDPSLYAHLRCPAEAAQSTSAQVVWFPAYRSPCQCAQPQSGELP